MGERCRCGADLLPGLHFCVGCGADLGSTAAARRPVAAARPPATAAPAAMRPATFGAAPSSPRRTFVAPSPMPAPLPPPVPWAGHAVAPVAYPPVVVAPAPRPSSPAPWLVAVSVFLVVLLTAGVVLVTLRPALVFGEPTPTVASASAAPNAAQPFLPVTTASAGDELRDQVDQDRARVESTTGWWVPQLSSKRSGTVDGGVRYDDETILGHYQGLAAQYPGAALLYSGDWPVFKKGDYWVVVVAQPFSTAAQANAWCDEQGFGADDCFAKSLSHSGGPTGTTVHR